MKAAILVRVSSKRQDTDRQEHDLREEAERRGWEVIEVVRETISGSADADAREGLERIRSLVEARKIDKVMVHEVTRIGRRTSVIHSFVEYLTERQISLYWHLQRMETLLPDGRLNHAATVIFALMAGLAKNETDMLSERIKSGMEEARRKGTAIGRPEGKWDDSKLLERHADAVKEIIQFPDLSIARLCKLTGVSDKTIIKLKKMTTLKQA